MIGDPGLVDCPACEGRGAYCLHAKDDVWSEMTSTTTPCDYCDGAGKINRAVAVDYVPPDEAPYFPYQNE